jgi:hypothetical protein
MASPSNGGLSGTSSAQSSVAAGAAWSARLRASLTRSSKHSQ